MVLNTFCTALYVVPAAITQPNNIAYFCRQEHKWRPAEPLLWRWFSKPIFLTAAAMSKIEFHISYLFSHKEPKVYWQSAENQTKILVNIQKLKLKN